jgi:hypothetical protein
MKVFLIVGGVLVFGISGVVAYGVYSSIKKKIKKPKLDSEKEKDLLLRYNKTLALHNKYFNLMPTSQFKKPQKIDAELSDWEYFTESFENRGGDWFFKDTQDKISKELSKYLKENLLDRLIFLQHEIDQNDSLLNDKDNSIRVNKLKQKILLKWDLA